MKMKTKVNIICVSALALIVALVVCPLARPEHPASAADGLYTPTVSVYFSPDGGCTSAIVREVDGAKSSLYLQAYSFTSKPITNAIVRAEQRGVIVHAMLDHSQEDERSSKLSALLAAHIPVVIDHVHRIAHNKIIIIDGTEVITGSFNFTASAETENAENLLILHDKALANRYLQNYTSLAQVCDKAE